MQSRLARNALQPPPAIQPFKSLFPLNHSLQMPPTSRPRTAICSSAAFETAATLLKVDFCAVRPPARHAQPSTSSVLDRMEPSR
eukprot:scaffold6748_cov122-Isochrysis_galbana.AAC.17